MNPGQSWQGTTLYTFLSSSFWLGIHLAGLPVGYAEEGVLVGCRILTGFLVGYIEGVDSQCYTKEEGFNSHRLVILFGSLWVFETWIERFELKNFNLKIEIIETDPKSDLKKRINKLLPKGVKIKKRKKRPHFKD